MKKYKIVTIQDLVNVVSKENIDELTNDLDNFLRSILTLKKTVFYNKKLEMQTLFFKFDGKNATTFIDKNKVKFKVKNK